MKTNRHMTVEAARAALAPLGMALRVTYGEYRVAPNVYEVQRRLGLDFNSARELSERRACYTNDILDAVATAVAMSETAFNA